MLKKVSLTAFAIGAALAAPLKAQAQPEDLTIVFKVEGPSGEGVATHYYTRSKACFNQGDSTTIVDFTSGKIVNVSNEKKQYSETTFAEIEKAMTSRSAEMEKAMAGIPESLRRKMMGDAALDVTVIPGEVRTVAGVSCRNHIVALGERTWMEICAAASLLLPFEKAHVRDLVLLTAPIAKGNAGVNKMVEKVRAIEGLSLASTTVLNLMGKKLKIVTEATEIRKGSIESAVFETPTGFDKVESPFARMAR